jgi:hypothetical protein
MSTPEELPTTTPFKMSTPDGDADVWVITGENIDYLVDAAQKGDGEAYCALLSGFGEGYEDYMKDKRKVCSGCGGEFTSDNEPDLRIVVHFLEAVDEDGEDLVKLNALCGECFEGDALKEIVRRELEKMGVLRKRIMR